MFRRALAGRSAGGFIDPWDHGLFACPKRVSRAILDALARGTATPV